MTLIAELAATRFELSLSENPFPPLPSVRHAIDEVMSHANRYPEFLPRRLPELIADRIGARPDQVIVGAGATGVAMQMMQVVCDGKSMIFAAPTFDGYPIMADMLGIPAVAVPLTLDGQQDLSAMAAAIDENTGLIVVCRPHNPTGTLVRADHLEKFLRAVPPHIVVVVDEAYVEFVAEDDVLDTRRMIALFPNVVVLRTFSKAFGLAGLRIGYAFGVVELMARLRRRQVPFGMNAAAYAAVKASYAAEGELCQRVRRITGERESLRHALRCRGFAVPRSAANFLFIPGHGVADRLARHGVVAKSYQNGARVSVGDPGADAAVLAALTET